MQPFIIDEIRREEERRRRHEEMRRLPLEAPRPQRFDDEVEEVAEEPDPDAPKRGVLIIDHSGDDDDAN